MAFLLGSFTNGLFGGWNDMVNLHAKLQQIDNMNQAQRTGNAAQKAIGDQNWNNEVRTAAFDHGATAGYTGGDSGSSGGDTSYSDANLPPINLDKMPKPKYMTGTGEGAQKSSLPLPPPAPPLAGPAGPVDTSAVRATGDRAAPEYLPTPHAVSYSGVPVTGGAQPSLSYYTPQPVSQPPAAVPTTAYTPQQQGALLAMQREQAAQAQAQQTAQARPGGTLAGGSTAITPSMAGGESGLGALILNAASMPGGF